ncbi:hypothetical protein ABPG72_017858, partial [Tetrahymena utriculariae]
MQYISLQAVYSKESDSNQNQNQLSSPKIIQEFDKKFHEKKNKESSLKVEEDIKNIQKNQIDLTDNKDLEEKTNDIKSNQNSKNSKEEQDKVIKETQIQVNSHSMMKELHSDLTLKKKVLSQLSGVFIRDRQYQNVMVETYNIKDAQHVIVSYEDQEKKNIPDLLQQQGYSLIQQEISLKQELNKQECDINEYSNQLKKQQQICSQNQYHENSGKRTENLNNFNQLCNPNQQDQSQQDGNNYLNVDLQQPESTYLKQNKLQEQQHAHNTYDQQDQSKQDISNQQEILNNSYQSYIQIKINIEKQKELTEIYAYQIKQILDKIEEYKQQVVEINENQQEQEYFEKNNNNQVQSETLQKQKSKIFEKLNENQFCLSKILDSDNNQTLILGFYKEHKNQIFDCLDEGGNPQQSQSQKNFELLTQFKSGILQLKDYSEINSNTIQYCEQCENQNTCENYECFKNIKRRILDFLQNQKYLYCECQEKLIQGLIFQFNQEELMALYINFAYQIIFSFLKTKEVTQQNLTNQKAPDQYNQRSNFKQICNLKLVNEYQFKEYLVQNKLDGNNIMIDHVCKRLWDIMKFNAINETEVSETFKKNLEVIISILVNKKYNLCKSFISNHQEDIFIGYQEEPQDSYSDYVFAIKYNPPSSEISKYLLIQKFNEKITHFTINDFIHIFILQKDVFIQLKNNFEYISQIQIQWTKDYFEQINKDKINNLKNYDKSFFKININQILDDKQLTQLNNSLKKCSNLESLILNLQKESISDEQINTFFEDYQILQFQIPTCDSMSNDQRYSHMKFLLEACNQSFDEISIKHKQNEIGVYGNILKEDVICNLINLKQLELNL